LQGKAIWALGFFSFLSGLNAITAIFLAINLGIEGTFQPYLISTIISDIPVYYYLVISILATLIFLGGTASAVVSELSNKALLYEINAKTNDLINGQKSLDEAKRNIMKKFGDQEKEIKTVYTNLNSEFDRKLASAIDEIEKQVGEGFNEQAEMLKESNAKLLDSFESKFSEINQRMTRQLTKIEDNLQKYSQRVKKSTTAIANQEAEIAEIKMTLATLEDVCVQPKPLLTSQSKTEEVRGIGENTGNELREMGITNVGELVLTEAEAIAEKTDMSEKTIEKLQGRAQLSMIPGVNEKALILLEEADIMNRKDLAEQDPIDLGKKINAAFKIYVEEGKITEDEKPTIEEIQSWIKFAKT